MRRTCLVFLLAAQVTAFAQEANVATDLLERSAEELEIVDFELEELQRLLEDPINVNVATAADLVRIPWLDAPTAERIVAYRIQNEAFRTWGAVREALGSEEHLFDRIRPLLVLGPASPVRSNARRRSRGDVYVATQVYWRRDTDIPHTRGARLKRDTERRMVTRVFVESPQGLTGRLTLARGGSLASPRIGGAELRVFGDRISIVGGAYGVRFGSGLVFSGGGIRDTWRFASGASAIRSARIAPRSSASTDDHLRGGALSISPLSGVRASALVGAADEGRERLLAFMVERSGAAGSFAVMFVRSHLELQPVASGDLHTLRRFDGGLWRAAAVSFERTVGAHRLGAEVAVADPGVGAAVVSLSTRMGSSSHVTVLLRSVSSRFSMRHGPPAAVEASDGTGETGALVAGGTKRGPWAFRFVADASARPWANASSAWPGDRWSFRTEITREVGRIVLTARGAHARSTDDVDPTPLTPQALSAPRSTWRSGFRLQADVPVGRLIEARFRWEVARARGASGVSSTSALLYQQVRWRPTRWLVVEARDASFIVQATEARLYVHETDVLYQPVLSTFTGDGFRRFLRVRLDVGPHVVVEAKAGLLEQARSTSDPAPAPIQRRTDARVQIRVKR